MSSAKMSDFTVPGCCCPAANTKEEMLTVFLVLKEMV
jgi:hypothetical protein